MKQRIQSLNNFVNESDFPSDELKSLIPEWVKKTKDKFPKTDKTKLKELLDYNDSNIQNIPGITFKIKDHHREAFRDLWMFCYDYEIDPEWLENLINGDSKKYFKG
jgi:hypothetical protein